MRGRWRRLSLGRRLMADAMHVAVTMPTVCVQRVMALAPAVAARNAGAARPPWSAIFAKAYAIAAAEIPELRRAFVRHPWPHFYEYDASVASITVERAYEGESIILGYLVKDPAALPLAEIGRRLLHARDAPLDAVREFRLGLLAARLPLLLRRLLWWLGINIGRSRANFLGTFGVSAVAVAGTELLSVPSTWPVFVCYCYSTLNDDGRLAVMLAWDHRLFDGGTAGRALARMEEIINGPIADEMRGQAEA